MAEYLYFLPQSKNLTAPATGGSDMLYFDFDPNAVRNPISAETYANWISIRQVDEEHGSIQIEIEPNTEGERTAVISIVTSAYTEGQAYYTIDYDITTIRQESTSSGSGSILPNQTSFTPKAEGDSGSVSFTTSNVITSSIGISCDSPYVTISPLQNSSYITTGFTWSVPENSGPSARQFTITISAKRSNNNGYAYAYVSGVQPSINNVGFIQFQYDTVRASATTMTSSIDFETNQVSAITDYYTDDYWLHVISATIDRDEDPRYLGTMVYQIDDNPYNYGRQGQVTIFGLSNVDDSLVQTTLHFYQAANATGGAQLGYIYCNNPVIIMDSPEAISNVTICQFKMAYNPYVVLSSVTASSYTGNFATAPYFPDGDKAALCFTLSAATSTTEYTKSTVEVSGLDTNDNVIPPILLTVLQPPYIEYIEFPIWKDTDLVIPTENEYLLYKITINGTIVYAGRGYAMDGNVTIRLNEIMQQVLLPDLDLDADGLQDNNAYANAEFAISLNGTDYQRYKQIKTYADWSYEDTKRNILSNPIRNKLDSRQRFVCSCMDYAGNGPTVIMTLFDEGGNTARENVYTLSNQIGTIVQKDINGVIKVEIDTGEGEVESTTEYEVVCELGRYCLYYLNADGGWDSFVFNKTSKEKDSFERLKYSTNQSNQTIRHRTIEYKNKIKKTWTLKTDYLTDRQSLNFAENLVGSPCVYLHDLEEGKIYPVLINTNSVDYQTFRRNGKKLNKYSIDVELAQIRQRR